MVEIDFTVDMFLKDIFCMQLFSTTASILWYIRYLYVYTWFTIVDKMSGKTVRHKVSNSFL